MIIAIKHWLEQRYQEKLQSDRSFSTNLLYNTSKNNKVCVKLWYNKSFRSLYKYTAICWNESFVQIHTPELKLSILKCNFNILPICLHLERKRTISCDTHAISVSQSMCIICIAAHSRMDCFYYAKSTTQRATKISKKRELKSVKRLSVNVC